MPGSSRCPDARCRRAARHPRRVPAGRRPPCRRRRSSRAGGDDQWARAAASVMHPTLAIPARPVQTGLAQPRVQWPDMSRMFSVRRPSAAGDPGELRETGWRSTMSAGDSVSTADRLRAHVALTKPRIVELLLATALPTTFLAAGGLPPLWPTVGSDGRRHPRRGVGQHLQQRLRPRHRRGDAAYLPSTGRHGDRRASAPASSRACCWRIASAVILLLMANPLSALLALAGDRLLRRSATRCCSSGARRRTSCGAVPPAACPCSSPGRPSRAR